MAKETSPFQGRFSSWADVQREFQMKERKPDEVYVADYESDCCDGYADVIYRRGENYFVAGGSHCSCYGLEGQWAPEKYDRKTFLKALRLREQSSHRSEPFRIALKAALRRKKDG